MFETETEVQWEWIKIRNTNTEGWNKSLQMDPGVFRTNAHVEYYQAQSFISYEYV